MNNPIRVAQIMGKMNNGGVEAVVMNYYRAIDKTKIQFDFIVDSDSNCPQKEEIEKLGGRVIFVPPYSKYFKYKKELKKVFLENKYQVVHSHLTTLNVFPLGVAKKCKVSVRISHAHSTAGKGEHIRNCIKYILRPFSKKNPTHLFACGEYAGRWLYGKKAFKQGIVTVLNNAIDVNRFKFDSEKRNIIRQDLGISNETFVIGHIGRFVSQKNHKFLIDVFADIHKKRPNTMLVLIGEGPLENETKLLVEKYSISDNVLFLGVKHNTFDYYNVFDAFYLPSIYEGLPVVGVEAQCNGLPCLFSDQMTREILINENSTMLPLNETVWVNKMELCRITNVNVDKYDIKKNASILEQKYEELVGESQK